MDDKAPQVTKLLHAWRAGDNAALDELLPIVYAQLRSIAARYMRKERTDHTLCPTALVNEAYMRLFTADVLWQDRAHFLAISALTMRRILVDHAKMRQRVRRGSGAERVPLDDSLGHAIFVSLADPAQMIDLDNALRLLERQDARKARLLELVYFGGLTGEESAEVLGVSLPTVNRDLKLSRAWLRHELQLGSQAENRA
jgi:RNA polymerase sigma factor (TIGR02999 family)